jgi:hypothetical protein
MTVRAVRSFAKEEMVSVTEDTVKKLDPGSKRVVIATKNGTERTFALSRATVVHRVAAMKHGSKASVSDLTKWSEVVVHYSSDGVLDTGERSIISTRAAYRSLRVPSKASIAAQRANSHEGGRL